MARGSSRLKLRKKQAGQKKEERHDQKAAAKATFIYACTICRTRMPDAKTFQQHFECKHPKTPLGVDSID
uniref:Zinc finger protein 706 n=1 Tax=Canis lupus familiaris TaxID=9615 RepID=A0A8C0RD64_CANLF